MSSCLRCGVSLLWNSTSLFCGPCQYKASTTTTPHETTPEARSRCVEIRAREAKATKGPWCVDRSYDGGSTIAVMRDFVGPNVALAVHGPADWVHGADAKSEIAGNAEFIAYARSDVPYLLAALEAERAQGDDLRAVNMRADYDILQITRRAEAAEAHLADLSARLRAREDENQELKDRLARRDADGLSERQPAASTGIVMIAAERQRQIQAEGWSAEHDNQHQQAELVEAAICYAAEGSGFSPDILSREKDGSPTLWPWESCWWKPKDPIRNLARAGALIAAELDRQLRSDQPPSSDARPTD